MKATNVSIAIEVEKRGYNFKECLEQLDLARTPKDEQEEISIKEFQEIIDNICNGFEEEKESL
jgi:hypothetical protein